MKNNKYLDADEKAIIESFSAIDKKKIARPSKREQSIFKKAAKDYIRSQTKMNIRIDQEELDVIKQKAAIDGLKYQTFVKSILHKYVTGQLIEKKYR
jgi:predicted DNA binding CopG/RHH family protein